MDGQGVASMILNISITASHLWNGLVNGLVNGAIGFLIQSGVVVLTVGLSVFLTWKLFAWLLSVFGIKKVAVVGASAAAPRLMSDPAVRDAAVKIGTVAATSYISAKAAEATNIAAFERQKELESILMNYAQQNKAAEILGNIELERVKHEGNIEVERVKNDRYI